MSLNDLNNELYRQNLKIAASRAHEASNYDPMAQSQDSSSSPFNQNEIWQKERKELVAAKKKKFLIIGISVFSVIILLTGGILFYRWWQKNSFFQDRVEISFEGPKEADSTQVMKYAIHYKNNNRVTLKKVEVQLDYSENFQPIDNPNVKYISPSSSKVFIEDIKPMSEGTIDLKGIFYAPKDFPVFLHANLKFVPSNGTSELSVENQISINITAAPVILGLIAPKEMVNGDKLEYVIDYKNLDIRGMNNVQIRVDFPQGFQMSSAEPRPSEKDSYWYIGNLESNQGGKIVIKGTMAGNSAENKTIVAQIGQTGGDNKFVVFSKQESNTQITSPILAIKQSLDGRSEANTVVNAGDKLDYVISYQNTGDVVMRNAIITTEIKGKILDFSKIKIEKGSYNGETGVITWKASDVPGLANIAPKTEGKVFFTIPIKNIIPVDNKLDKNMVISSIAKIDSPDIPTPIDSNKIIGSNSLELKLASKVIFDTRAYYNDANIKNTGPIPMKTGAETTFAVHWSIINISNDISGAKIVSSLPSGVRWTGSIYPSDEKIAYNERTNQIIWEAGDISAGTGVLDGQRMVEFQVGVTPQLNQIGQPMALVNKSTLTAKDTFVVQDIAIDSEKKDTQLPEDPAIGYVNGKVAKN